MKYAIRPVNQPINTHIVIPGSKSITNRALLIASLASGVSKLTNILISEDTLVFVKALQQLGIDIVLNAETKSCVIKSRGGLFSKESAQIECVHSGTTLRFLLAACAASAGQYHFDGSERLRQRPIASLTKVLNQQGAKCSADKMPLMVVGCNGLTGGEITVDNAETSQFLSGLLMISPFAKKPTYLRSQQPLRNPYVKMTCAVMKAFGVNVTFDDDCYVVKNNQRYIARPYQIEPDLSTASYFFAAAAITEGKITIANVDRKHVLQGDVKFLDVLEKMGCEVIQATNGVTVKGPRHLQGIEIDMREFSDTFMTLAAIAAFAKTPTTIMNIAHTRLQESDRISAMRKNLDDLQIKTEEGPDWLKIYPSEPQAATISSHNDHRIAMACSLIGLRVSGIIINDAECVAKTCPDFFNFLARIS